jgi:hypothetical protein
MDTLTHRPAETDELLDRLLAGAPKLAALRERLPSLTRSQKETLLRKLQQLDSRPAAIRQRILPRQRADAQPPPVNTLSDNEVHAQLLQLLEHAESPKLRELIHKLPELTVNQSRALLAQLLALSFKGLKTARLSHAQQRCWFMELLDPGKGTQNIAAAVRAQGPLDLALVSECINVLIERHEVLRTNFISSPSGPRQLIRPSQKITIAESEFDQDSVLQAVLAEAYCPFDLAAGPLIRLNSFRIGPEERILLLTMHHIVGDEWSIGVLIEELGMLYAHNGNSAVLPPLPIQFADYCEWQVETFTPAALRAELEYWKRKLAGAEYCLEIPPDRPRPKVRTTNGSMETLALPHRAFERMAALARSEQATLFMAMCTAFKVLLHLRTGREDILVGTDFANRDRSETAKLIGFFVNELVLRTDLSGDPSFRELLRQVRRTAIEAFNHQELPFQWLVEELKPPRDPSRTPVYQVVFDLHNIPMTLEFQGVALGPMRLPLRPAKYDLTLFISESPRDLYALLEYNTDLYDRSTAQRFLNDYQSIVSLAAQDPDVLLSRLRTEVSASRRLDEAV